MPFEVGGVTPPKLPPPALYWTALVEPPGAAPGGVKHPAALKLEPTPCAACPLGQSVGVPAGDVAVGALTTVIEGVVVGLETVQLALAQPTVVTLPLPPPPN